jgi:lipopolysaccharide biosynthesis regulator YciM
VRIGTIHYVRGNWPDAVLALERAVELGEEDIDVYLELGVSYANLNECNNAARYLRQAQQLAAGDERVESIAQSAFEQCADSGILLATATPIPSPTPTPTLVPAS